MPVRGGIPGGRGTVAQSILGASGGSSELSLLYVKLVNWVWQFLYINR